MFRSWLYNWWWGQQMCYWMQNNKKRRQNYQNMFISRIFCQYKYYPIKISNDFIMSIYNTSILPKTYLLEGMTLINAYDILFVSSVYLVRKMWLISHRPL